MKKGITFCSDMILACIDLRKGRTTRIINPQPTVFDNAGIPDFACLKPKYQISDELCVKESYFIASGFYRNGRPLLQGRYTADDEKFSCDVTISEWELWKSRKYPYRKTPGRFMYKSLARIFLPPIERITVQRPQDLTEEECLKEGIQKGWYDDQGESPGRYLYYSGFDSEGYGHSTAKDAFKVLWDSLHGEGAYERNEWCFVPHWDSSKIEVRR